MKRLLTFSLILVATLMHTGCNKDDETPDDSNAPGIYGVITDFDTGEPVKNANVQLRPSGETTLTGSDGKYLFSKLAPGDYSITVSKAEYSELIDPYVIHVEKEMTRRDLQIEKLLATIQIVDNDLNPLYSLDYGASSNSMQFVIFNKGTVGIQVNVIPDCNWVSSISNRSCFVEPGGTFPIIVTIDRSKLAAGPNTGSVKVTSNNGNLSVRLTATGETIAPVVQTLPVTYIDNTITPWCNTFHGEVTTIGNPAYTERGFCYSSTSSTPDINDNCIPVAGTGLGEFSYTKWDFSPYTVRYYVRAWVRWENNQIIYGNVQTFVYNDVL